MRTLFYNNFAPSDEALDDMCTIYKNVGVPKKYNYVFNGLQTVRTIC